MLPRIDWHLLLLLATLGVTLAEEPDKAVTFSHVYKLGSGCNQDAQAGLLSQDQSADGQVITLDGENDIVFKHSIRLASSGCSCADSEEFKALLYRVNGLEEEVTYLKSQCTQGCCKASAGVDTSCSGHGTFQHDTCSCKCNPGWEGPDCSTSSCPDNCNDNGYCVDGQCVCHAGYTGHDCGLLTCPDDCNDKGHCVDGKCVCFEGFTGDNCDVQLCPDDCNNKGHCVDGKCVCFEGFTGENCDVQLCPDDCNDKGHCVDGKCVCFKGFTGDNCDVQLCPDNCKNKGHCVDGKCVCFKGFTGDNCDVQLCPDNCNNKGHCVDGKCVCFEGFTGDNCDVQLCPDDCNNKGHCVDGKCVCFEGFTGDNCDVQLCPDDCNNKGHCVDGKCVCFEGFTGDNCNVQLCPSDCNDSGRCVDGQCVCNEGFFGSDCSMALRPPVGPYELESVVVCPESTAPSLGVKDGRHTGYPGHDCGLLSCPDDCINKGHCVDVKCVCFEGFTGENCDVQLCPDDCNNKVLSPTGLRLISVTDVSLLVEWQHVKGAEHYVLSYYPDGNEGAIQEVQVPNTENSYLITGLKSGVTYIVQVYAVIRGISSESDRITAKTDFSGVQGIRVLGQTENSIQVDWQNPENKVDFFKLKHASPEGQEGLDNVLMSQEARTMHTIIGLNPGTEYQIIVQAIQGSSEGKLSHATGVTDIDAPTNLVTTDITESTVTVTWEKVRAEIDGYILTYSSADGSSKKIQVGADATSYQFISLKPGVLYTITIWAYKGSRLSRKSSTEAETEIDAPENLKAVNVQMESADLTWKAPQALIEGYILTYRPEDGSMQAVEQKLKAGDTRFSLSGLSIGKKYIITLIAYRGLKRSKVVETTFSTVGAAYPFPMDCTQIMNNGNTQSGVFTIYVANNRSKPMQVYCDMTTDGGGWIVFQRRNTGRLEFRKGWKQYVNGFGELTDEFWLGLEKLYELTNTPTKYEVRFDLGLRAERVYAVYDDFKLGQARQKFKLTVGNYRGNAGDAMTYHQGRPFTTVDSDNDIALGNCALTHHGAWWYKNCHLANLNGKHGDNNHSIGMNWEPWKGHLTSLDFSEIKIRPVGTISRKKRSLRRREAV